MCKLSVVEVHSSTNI